MLQDVSEPMTRQTPTSGFGKLSAGALMLLVVVSGGWAVYRFGPKPSAAHTPAEAVVSAQPLKAPERVAPQTNADQCEDDSSFNPLGVVTNGGHAAEGAQSYLDRLEKVYQRRGYKDFGGFLAGAKKKDQPPPAELKNLYWRTEAEGANAAYIGAIGRDADPNRSEPAPETLFCATIISPAGEGGSQWATHCSEVSKGASPGQSESAAADSDFAGTDPPGIPRPEGLRRVLSLDNSGRSGGSMVTLYASNKSGAALTNWYLTEMSPSWRFDPLAAAEAGELVHGAMTFTQGRRFCLIWVSPGKGGDPTTVIISLQQ